MAAFMYRGRSALRSRKYRGIQDSPDDEIKLDYTKDPEENVREILINVIRQRGLSQARRLSYMNAFVKLSGKLRRRKNATLTLEEVLCCLRVGLVNESKEMRAATLRVLRYICTDEESVQILLRLGIDHLIARSIDIWLDNEIERIHALRLVRRILSISPLKFPRSIFEAVLSVACDGAKERDRMVSVCLATLSELAITNSALFGENGGVGVILKSILDCYQFPRINESLLSVILFLLNWPQTRHYVPRDVTLEKLLAPFTDNHYRFNDEGRDQDWTDHSNDRFAACKMAVATMMKSWPGIIRMCNPESSGLQSLLAVLYLPHMETQKEVMDIIFDVVRLPVPVWTDDFNKALLSIDTSEMRDTWRLNEGFVVQEGKDILPHIAKTRSNLVENHVALILLTLIGAGLPEALVEIIRTGTDFLCVRATLLLADLLYLTRVLFPPDLTHRVQTLPSLLALATSFDISPAERNRASTAICQLKRVHAMRKRGPRPCSFFLNHLMSKSIPTVSDSLLSDNNGRDSLSTSGTPQTSSNEKEMRRSGKSRLRKGSQCSPIQCITPDPQSKMEYYTNAVRDADHEKIQELIKDSLVITSKENSIWDWDIIAAVLKRPDRSLRNLEDPTSHRFVRRLLFFFKPSNNKFSTTELSSELHRKLVVAGLHFVDLMATSDTGMEFYEIARDFLSDIVKCLNEVTTLSRSSAESVFRSSSLADSCSQYYFLFLGHFALTATGDGLLNSLQIYNILLNIITQAPSDIYVKVIIGSFNYSQGGTAREILSKSLTVTSEASRKFATVFMRVLLRAHVSGFSKWGIQLLVSQLTDPSTVIATEALSVLSEATEDEACLKTMIDLNPPLTHLGYKGALLSARFLSDPIGFKILRDQGYLDKELDKWHKEFNLQYVKIVEERLNEALTTYEKSYDGSYVRRSHSRVSRKDCFVPVHLYGQLVQHEQGYSLLKQLPYISELFNVIQFEMTKTEEQVMRVKSALWAVGHIGSSSWGAQLLEERDIVPQIIKLAEESGVFSLRGTSFYVLGLIASTNQGVSMLARFGWESTCRNRIDQFSTDFDSVFMSPFPDSVAVKLFRQASSSSEFCSFIEDAKTDKQVTKLTDIAEVTKELSLPGTPTHVASFFIGYDKTSRSNTLSSQDLKEIMEKRSSKSLRRMGSNGGTSSPKSGEGNRLSKNVGQASHAFSDTVNVHDSVKDRLNILKSEFRRSQEIEKKSSLLGNVEGISSSKLYCNLEGTSPTKSANYSGSCPEPLAINSKFSENICLSDMNVASDVCNRLPSISASANDSVLCPNHVTPNNVLPTENSLSTNYGSYQQPSHMADTSSGDSGNLTSSSMVIQKVSNKDRSDTDITATSDRSSSLDSGAQVNNEMVALTPIPSANSMTTSSDHIRASLQNIAVPMTPTGGSLLHSHPSDIFRTHANLRRVPSMKRPGSHTALGTMCGHSDQPVRESSLASGDFDSRGFAALRELRRQRTETAEESNNIVNEPLHEEMSSNSLTTFTVKTEEYTPTRMSGRTRSRFLGSHVDSPIMQNASDVPLRTKPITQLSLGISDSLFEQDSMQLSPSSKYIRQQAYSSDKSFVQYGNRQEFVGICLPIDVRMMFQVSENEDSRSSLELQHDSSCSCPNKTGSSAMLSSQSTCSLAMTQPTLGRDAAAEGLEYHNRDTCLGCMRVRSNKHKNASVSNGLKSVFTEPSDLHALSKGRNHHRPISAHSTVQHQNECLVIDGEDLPMVTEDSPQGRVMVRKEVMKFVVNLASAIGCKASEQGLLILKQRFPRAFSDLCLYSEVCYLLSHYHYRLTARRFIQELFLDSDFIALLEEPRDILDYHEIVLAEEDKDVTPRLLCDVPEQQS